MKKLLYILLLPIWFACNEPGQPAQISFGAAAQPGFPQISQLKKSGPVVLKNVSDTVIEYLHIKSEKEGIYGENCKNVTIRYLIVESYESGIEFHNSSNIRVNYYLPVNCRTGAYFYRCTNVYYENNEIVNPTSKTRQLPQYFPDGRRLGQAIQLDRCAGDKVIRNNRGKVFDGDSFFVEDWVNNYGSESSGLVLIEGNVFDGGNSPSGGGILVGDQGQSGSIVRNNKVWNVGNYGIAVAGGNNHKVYDNDVYQERTSVASVSYYVLKLGGATCTDIEFYNNRNDAVNKEGNANWFGLDGSCSGRIERPIAVKNITKPERLITFVTDAQLYSLRKGLPLPNEGALPVTWGDIKYNGKDTLVFTTVTEDNNKGFEVEESLDNGITYKSVSKLPAKGAGTYKAKLPIVTKSVGGGGCTAPTQERVNSRKIYRVKQIDIDGKSSYSKTLTIVR